MSMALPFETHNETIEHHAGVFKPFTFSFSEIVKDYVKIASASELDKYLPEIDVFEVNKDRYKEKVLIYNKNSNVAHMISKHATFVVPRKERFWNVLYNFRMDGRFFASYVTPTQVKVVRFVVDRSDRCIEAAIGMFPCDDPEAGFKINTDRSLLYFVYGYRVLEFESVYADKFMPSVDLKALDINGILKLLSRRSDTPTPLFFPISKSALYDHIVRNMESVSREYLEVFMRDCAIDLHKSGEAMMEGEIQLLFGISKHIIDYFAHELYKIMT